MAPETFGHVHASALLRLGGFQLGKSRNCRPTCSSSVVKDAGFFRVAGKSRPGLRGERVETDEGCRPPSRPQKRVVGIPPADAGRKQSKQKVPSFKSTSSTEFEKCITQNGSRQ